MSELKLTLLGSPHAILGEKSIVVESRKALALLFYLAVTGQRHSRDRLATLFWPDQDQARARASLRQGLWLLRNAGLEPWLVIDQDALALQAGYWCDVHLFQAELDAGNLTQALALYHDDLLTGFSLRDCPEFDQWQFLQADALRRQLAEALKQWVLRSLEAGEYAHGLDYARRWLALDPLHEPIHRHLMQLYAYAGQQAAALRQYEECVRLLEEELGVTPEAETTALYHAIKTREIAPPPAPAPVDLRSDPVTIAAVTPTAINNLPTQLTPFVGRESELDELEKILTDEDCRLVTVIGPGGIGKTRLAVQVARRFIEDASPHPGPPIFPHGVLFVALSAVESTSGIVAAIAEASGFIFYNNLDPRQQLLASLRDKKLLLLLDNFEQLLAGADLIGDILTHAPRITVLVTSREALNLHGEWQWPVQGLPAPKDGTAVERLLEYSAVRLFVQSARRVQPDFSLATDCKEVVHICRLVGGMPLAIELAAAWLRVLPCAQIAREIEQDLSFLTTRLRDVPDRHRSIQAVFEHSWRLLSPSEQTTFQQLSIFRGGFHRNAAAQVTGASWLDLATLVEKSLLSVDTTGRYVVHELLRQYGAGKLAMDPAEEQATIARHGRYFADFLGERLEVINGEAQHQAANEIATELDNIRAAWQWSLQQHRLNEISRIISTYYCFCQLRSRFLEGIQALQAAQVCLETLQPAHQRDLTLAYVLNHQGWLYIRLGQLDQAAAVLKHSRELYTQLNVPPQTIMGGDSRIALAIVYLIQGDYRRAVELSEESRLVAEGHRSQHNLAFAHYALTAAQLALGDYAAAQVHAHHARRAARATGMSWFLAYVLNESGKVARAMDNLIEAEHYFRDSYTIKEEFGDPEGMAVALNHLGEIACLQEDYAKAAQLYQAAIALYQGINDRGGLATAYKGLGEIACAQRDQNAARQHFAHALNIATEIHFWPLAFSILLSVSRLLMQTGAQALALDVLRLIQQQPASDHETKKRATQQLRAWQDAIPADQFADAMRLGKIRPAEAVIALIVAEFEAALRLSNQAAK